MENEVNGSVPRQIRKSIIGSSLGCLKHHFRSILVVSFVTQWPTSVDIDPNFCILYLRLFLSSCCCFEGEMFFKHIFLISLILKFNSFLVYIIFEIPHCLSFLNNEHHMFDMLKIYVVRQVICYEHYK